MSPVVMTSPMVGGIGTTEPQCVCVGVGEWVSGCVCVYVCPCV